jgi:group I intron endonuclease
MSGTNEKNYILYLHTTPIGKRYYGITKQKPKRRWRGGSGYKKNQFFWRAITKYGWNNIKHEILFEGLTEHEAKGLEQYMIQWYDTANPKYGYNITLGGEGTNGLSGENHPMYGKHHSEETKQKMSENHADFSGENNPRYGKGYLIAGENHPMYGKHHSEESKQKMSETMKGRNNPKAKSVICLTTKRIFFTGVDAADYYNTHQQSISKCCKGKRKTAGKYNGQPLKWKYLNYKHDRIYRIA